MSRVTCGANFGTTGIWLAIRWENDIFQATLVDLNYSFEDPNEFFHSGLKKGKLFTTSSLAGLFLQRFLPNAEKIRKNLSGFFLLSLRWFAVFI